MTAPYKNIMIKNANNKGIAIFISLALLFLVSAAAIAVLLTAYNYSNICEGQIRRLKAITSAEAGVNYAYWKIRIGKDDSGNDIVYPCTLQPPIAVPAGWAFQVTITNDSPHKIQSKVTYPKSRVQ